jgi:RecB family exonuclease
MAKHSKFSPSGAPRWLRCPASIRLSEGFPETTNPASQRGTEIHAQAEHVLLNEPGDGPFPDHSAHAAEYANYVRALMGDDDELYVERCLSFKTWAPEGFGTADVVIVPRVTGVARIVDLKTGRIPVSATTEQLLVYACALLETFPDRMITSVEVHVWQNGRTDKISYCRVELLEFAVKVLAPAAKAALDPETKPVAGEKQCEWCKARFTCAARAIDALQGAGELFGGSDLSVVLPAAKKFDGWLKDVEQVAMERLAQGIAIAGFKLVEGDTKSVWREDAQTVLGELGIDPEVFLERRMRTITEVKKAVGKEMAALVQGATTKPAGKPRLTTEDDPRKDLNDF